MPTRSTCRPARLVARALVLAGFAGTTAGCVVHTRGSELALGPAFARRLEHTAETEAGKPKKTFLVNVVQFPLVVEMGRTWGVTLGYMDRLSVAAIPAPPPETILPPNETKPPPLRPTPLVHHVRWTKPPEFSRRRFLGISLHAWEGETGVRLGYANQCWMIPEPEREALYLLRYDATHPMDTVLYWDSVTTNSRIGDGMRKAIESYTPKGTTTND